MNTSPTRFATLAAPACVSSSASSAKAGGTLGSRACFVDVYLPAVQLITVELFDGLISGVGLHLDEPKSARTSRIPIGDYRGRYNFTGLREQTG
jgi:hypothetical protein